LKGFHNVAFLGEAPRRRSPFRRGTRLLESPDLLSRRRPELRRTGYQQLGVPGPDGQLSYTLTFTKPGRYPYICGIHSGNAGMVIVTDKATGTPAAALRRGRAEQAATLAAGRARFAPAAR